MSNSAPVLTKSKGQREPRSVSALPGLRLVGIAAGLAAGITLVRARSQASHRPMPHLKTFQHALTTTHGEVGAAVLAARVQERYNRLYAARPRFDHAALRWHLDYQILPGLALYEILRENAVKQGTSPTAALSETATLLERMDVMARWLPLLRYQPFAFRIFRGVARLSLVLFPAKGWDIQMLEDSPQRFAFNISRCFYLDVLTAYGAPELTQHFCHLDDVAYAALPPHIKWERTTTLARGGPYCDFCWRSVGTESPQVEESAVPDRPAEPHPVTRTP